MSRSFLTSRSAVLIMHAVFYVPSKIFHNVVSAIFRDIMRYYAISGDIWRYWPIFALRLALLPPPPQIHGTLGRVSHDSDMSRSRSRLTA